MGTEIQYLPIQAFQPEELEQAEDLFDRLTTYVSEKDLTPQDIPDLAEKAAARIASRAGLESPAWRALTPEEEWQMDGTADTPPDHAQEELLQAAYDLGGVNTYAHPAIQALNEIGLSAGDFDPDTDPPPFYDEVTQTAYWIGVYQPDPQDRDTCVASILSLTRDRDTGAYAAQLAPCVVGDWDKAYQASDYLIGIAQRSDDIERVFEAAEGMAIATDQRHDWQHERGVSLELDSAEAIGTYAAQQWELEL
jgi:hypothetical protein